MSQQLAKLEAEVGVPLLQRVGRGVRLTPQAQVLVAHTEAVLAHLEQAEADLAASTDEFVGTARVAAFQGAAFAFVPAVLTRLAAPHPRLRVDAEVREPEEAIAGLLAHDFDLVIDEEYPGAPIALDDGFDRQLLLDDALLLVVPASWGPVHSLAEVEQRPWGLEPPGTRARTWAEASCRERGSEPEVRFAFDDLPMRPRMVETGHAATPLPDLAPIPHAGSIAAMALPHGPVRRLSTVVRSGTTTHPVTLALRQALHVAVVARPPRHLAAVAPGSAG